MSARVTSLSHVLSIIFVLYCTTFRSLIACRNVVIFQGFLNYVLLLVTLKINRETSDGLKKFIFQSVTFLWFIIDSTAWTLFPSRFLFVKTCNVCRFVTFAYTTKPWYSLISRHNWLPLVLSALAIVPRYVSSTGWHFLWLCSVYFKTASFSKQNTIDRTHTSPKLYKIAPELIWNNTGNPTRSQGVWVPRLSLD